MSIGTRLYTWLNGDLVGTDSQGNRYYRERRKRQLQRGGGLESRERRWVLYAGEVEATRVPPEWHGWLHNTVDVVPTGNETRRPWQKPHEPNHTGTARAYFPRGAVVRGAHRAPSTGDYEAWTP